MKLALITAAIATDFEDADEAANDKVRGYSTSPQLGPLSLAGIVQQTCRESRIVDIDRLYYQYLEEFGSRCLHDFPAWAAPLIVSSGAEIYGFSSICSSYPLTIRIAERVKREQPDCTILFGGPQASVVDLPTLAAFPFIDFVLRGEAEQSLPLFLDEWSGSRRYDTVPGLTYRSPFGPARNPAAPVIQDLDSLPLPAYHLTGELRGARFAPLELGRGCPFSCTFCSTNDFFRRKFRIKSPARVLEQMRMIYAEYGIRAFELTHDMFTVDRKRVVAFCEHLIDAGDGFTWSCSARTDCIDEELLELMAAAGCKGLFFGVETGSRRMQRIIDKDLDPDRAKAMVSAAERLGIDTTVSLITGFPEENYDDLRETANMFAYSMRHPKSTPQLNLLAPLAGTPIYSQHKDRMILEEFASDMSHQGRFHNEADRQLIRDYPHIFPNFYLLPAPDLDRAFLLELREFLRLGETRMRWLLVALHQCGRGILDVCAEWREHRMSLHPEIGGLQLRYYYMLHQFVEEFVSFVRARLAQFPSMAVEALVTYHELLIEQKIRDSALARSGAQVSGPFRETDIPVRAQHLHIIALDWDIQEVIESLKRGEPATLARAVKTYRTDRSPNGARLIEITPVVARALQYCDGRRDVDQFTVRMSKCFEGSSQFRREAARGMLPVLREKGLIEVLRPAIAPTAAIA